MERVAQCDVVAFGEISYDTFVVSGAVPPSAGKVRVRAIIDAPGGQAATFAVGCRRLGWRTRLIGAVGDDSAAAMCRDATEREGVDAMVFWRPGVATRRAVVHVERETGDRRVAYHRDSRLDLDVGEVPAAYFTDGRLLMVDATDVRTAIRAAAAAREAGVTSLVDVDEVIDQTYELLRHIDLVVLAAEVVPPLSGRSGVGEGVQAIARATGALIVTATLGEEGAIAWANGREWRAVPPGVGVVDTTGAGDAFRAGVAAAWLGAAGRRPGPVPAQELLDAGVLVGALNCRAIGAQAALPSKAEVPQGLWGPL